MASFDPPPHTIHIHNAPPIMHRPYQPPNTAPYVRNHSHNLYPMSYHPAYPQFPPGFDPSVSLAHPYIYDPNQVKHRRRTTPEQLKTLEETFKTDPKPNPALRKQLSLELGMSPRVLQVWFQNRRMKVKRLAKKRATAGQRSNSAEPEARDGDQSPDPSSLDVDTSASNQTSPGAMTPSTTDNHESPSSPATSTHSPAHYGGPSPDGSSTNNNDSAARLAPPQDAGSLRRGSLPALGTSNLGSCDDALGPSSAVDPERPRVRPGNNAFEGVPDPALYRRRSMTSLQRLESHPFAPFVAANNGLPQTVSHSVGPIVTPSLPSSFASRCRPSASAIYHHHSPSTPAPHLTTLQGLPQTNRSASFHVIPGGHQLHTSSQSQHHPYAFPPRPLPAPGPGPLPAPDFCFGTSTPSAPGPDDMQDEFDVRPYVPLRSSLDVFSVKAAAAAAAGVSVPLLARHDDDAETSYTGYSSRFGSIASVAESDTSASVSGQSICAGPASDASASCVSLNGWDSGERWDGRKGSWTGQVADMLSGLDVRGEGKARDLAYESMWADSPSGGGVPYASSSSQESLDAYKEGELLYPESKEGTPPAAHLPISQSSELAGALFERDLWAPYQTSASAASSVSSFGMMQQEEYAGQRGQGGGGDEMLELHHAMAGYAEHPSVAELTSSYSIGTFAAPGQDGNAPYHLY